MHRLSRQGSQLHTGKCIGGYLAKHIPQLMMSVELVVPIGYYKEAMGMCDPPGEKFDKVQRRLVGPVDVFEYDHEFSPTMGQRLQDAGKEASPVGEIFAIAPDVIPQLPDDVIQWRQWTRREQGITSALEDIAFIFLTPAKCPYQRGLADTGLPADQDTVSLALDGVKLRL